MLLFALAFTTTHARVAEACVHPNPTTVLRFILITNGPPVRIFLVFDPWLTFGTAPTDFCACGFKLPNGVIDTVDGVALVETGTSTVIPGFNFVADTDTSTDIEALINSGPSATWAGFSSDQSLSIPPDVSADLRVEATLLPGVSVNDLFNAFNGISLTNAVYTDEANPDGTLAGTHGGATAVSTVIIPTVQEWGLALMFLLMVAAMTIFTIRLAPVPAISDSTVTGTRPLVTLGALARWSTLTLSITWIACALAWTVYGSLALRDIIGATLCALVAGYILHLWASRDRQPG